MKRDDPIVELAERFDVHANQLSERNNQLLKQTEDVFLTETERRAVEAGSSIKNLWAKIGQRMMGNN